MHMDTTLTDAAPAHPPTQPAPGWYPTGAGHLAWWDGTRWTGHTAPAGTPETLGAFSASFAWWGALVGWFIPAAILYATNRPNTSGANPFVRFSAGEALNAQLTVLAAMIPVQVIYLWVMVTSFDVWDPASTTPPLGPWFFVVWAVSMATSFAVWALYILAAVRAHRGVWFEARYAIPFFRAHRALRGTR